MMEVGKHDLKDCSQGLPNEDIFRRDTSGGSSLASKAPGLIGDPAAVKCRDHWFYTQALACRHP